MKGYIHSKMNGNKLYLSVDQGKDYFTWNDTKERALVMDSIQLDEVLKMLNKFKEQHNPRLDAFFKHLKITYVK